MLQAIETGLPTLEIAPDLAEVHARVATQFTFGSLELGLIGLLDKFQHVQRLMSDVEGELATRHTLSDKRLASDIQRKLAIRQGYVRKGRRKTRGFTIRPVHLLEVDQLRESEMSVGMSVHSLLHTVITSEVVQQPEWRSILNGHLKLNYDKDPDAQFVQGVLFLLRYKTENLEMGKEIAAFAVKELSRRGMYEVLGSREFREKMENFAGQFRTAEQQDLVRYSSIEWFMKRSYHQMEHRGEREDAPFPFTPAGSEGKIVKKVFTLFRQVGAVQKVVRAGKRIEAKFALASAALKRAEKPSPYYLALVERHKKYEKRISSLLDRIVGTDHYNILSPDKKGDVPEPVLVRRFGTKLVYGKEGPLRQREVSHKNSNAQRAKVLLLSFPGVDRDVFDVFVDHMFLPPNTSRADTGLLPSVIIERLHSRELHPSVYAQPGFDEFADSVERRAMHNWPSPGDSSIPKPEAQIAAHFRALQKKHYGWLMS